jgi:hypothetical protein
LLTARRLSRRETFLIALRMNAMANTREQCLSQPLFYALVLFAGYLTYLVLSPFLVPLAWSAVFAMMFHRLQVELAPRIGPNRAALVTTALRRHPDRRAGRDAPVGAGSGGAAGRRLHSADVARCATLHRAGLGTGEGAQSDRTP